MKKVHDFSSDIPRTKNGEYKCTDETKDQDSEGTLKSAVTAFASEVSILGLKQLANSKYSLARKAVWLCLVLVGFAFLVFHLWNRLYYYLSSPATVNIQAVSNESLVFPAVTICNNSPFKTSSLVANNETHLGDLFGYLSPDHEFQSHNLSHFNWTDFHMRNGYTLDDILIDTYWKGLPLAPSELTPVITEFGLCYQFNAGKKDYRSEVQGAAKGFRVGLVSRRREHLKMSFLTGFTVVIHSPYDHPSPSTLGFYLTTGGSSNVALKLKHLKNLPPPHGICGEKPLAYYDRYSKINCETECFHNVTLKQCGCRQVHLPAVPGYRECSPVDKFHCIIPLSVNITEHLRNCDCKATCDSYIYDHSVSFARVSDSLLEALLKRESGVSLEEFEKDIVSMVMFYSDMMHEEFEQQEAYSALALMADVGGALGLVLGSTLMTLAEILDFASDLFVSKFYGDRK